MPARRLARTSGRRSNRRKLVWAADVQTLAFTAGAQVANIDLLTQLKVAGASVLGSTVMRTHVRIALSVGTVALGNELAWGLAVLPNNAVVAAGTAVTAAIPTPIQNPELDWMMWDVRVASPTLGMDGTNMIMQDVKSKRRLEELDQTYVLSLLMVTAFSAAPTFVVSTRTLLALP